MMSIPSIVGAFIGCALLGVGCPTIPVTHSLSIETFSTSSPSVIAVTKTATSTTPTHSPGSLGNLFADQQKFFDGVLDDLPLI